MSTKHFPPATYLCSATALLMSLGLTPAMAQPGDRPGSSPSRLAESFKTLDRDGDGAISLDEYEQGVPGLRQEARQRRSARREGVGRGPGRHAGRGRGEGRSGQGRYADGPRPHAFQHGSGGEDSRAYRQNLMRVVERKIDRMIEARFDRFLDEQLPRILEGYERMHDDRDGFSPRRGQGRRADRGRECRADRESGPRSKCREGRRGHRYDGRGRNDRAGDRRPHRPQRGQGMVSRLFDANQDGTLQVDEVQQFADRLNEALADQPGETLTPGQLKQILRHAHQGKQHRSERNDPAGDNAKP